MCHIPARPALRVLIADAHRDAADTLAMLVALWDYQPLTAYDGRTALELARRHRPDALLSEVPLPGLSGLDLARRLRQDVPCRVAITSHGRPEDRERCAEAGFDHFLLKPCEPRELQRLLADCAPGAARNGSSAAPR